MFFRSHSLPVLIALLYFSSCAIAQSLGGAGAIEGSVTDPSGAGVPGATVSLSNPITGYKRSITSDATGLYRVAGIPPNVYHLEVSAPGFTSSTQDLTVRTSIPVTVKTQLTLATEETSITVQDESGHIVENVPYSHIDVDRATLSSLPASSPGSGLSDAVTLSTPGVAADSNGLFHPLGDHAQTTFSIDGQPISDQQSKQFSTQFPLNAIQSMELITGAQPAEYGDKTSLVISAQTRSGLGHKPFGSFDAQYGSFGTVSEEAAFGAGTARAGNFLVVNAMRSGRFLDTPEFSPIHAVGNNGTIFDRVDFQPGPSDAIHLNLFFARNWFQVPNTYDQPQQDQRQRDISWNVAPGYQHTFNAKTLLTINAFIRRDQVNYYPSRDPFADTPATLSLNRHLVNYGFRTDLAYVSGANNLKVGTQVMRTHLNEHFSLGITDPEFNSGAESQPGLLPFDLTRGGTMFHFNGMTDINQYAVFVQDSASFGHLSLTGGLRVDRYDGLVDATGVQPRAGVSYQLPRIGTVVRASYARTFETPYNENLVLSSSTGSGGLAMNVFGANAAVPIQPGRRNQFNTGIEQALSSALLVTADYFWKFTDNAFDFGTLLNTPVQFPISWRKSKIDGVAVRFSTADIHGFRAYATMGHTRARYFGPSNGGLVFNSPLDTGVFRIDHDQAFQQTTNVHYERPKNGAWITFTWRYDSGLVAGAVPDVETVLSLTAAQQAAIGFFCGGTHATLTHRIAACDPAIAGAERIRIPAEGTADDDRNPARIAPRHVFDLAAGTGNLFRTDRFRTTVRLAVQNLTNQAALYNFLSTFSGTHFVAPRSYQAQLGFVF